MSDSSYSAAICHLLLAGSSAVSIQLLRSSGGDYKWAYGALGLYFVKSCLGVVRFGSEEGNDLAELYDKVDFVSAAVGLPCFATDLYLCYSIRRECALLHIVSSLLPVAVYFTNIRERNLLNLNSIGNAISVCSLGFIEENYYAIGAGLYYGIFCIRKRDRGEDLRDQNSYTLNLCLFNFLLVRSLRNSIYLPELS